MPSNSGQFFSNVVFAYVDSQHIIPSKIPLQLSTSKNKCFFTIFKRFT